MAVDPTVLDWLKDNHERLVGDLADLVAIPSISTDGEHQHEIDQTAELTCEQMRQAGLQNVAVLRTGDSNPYAYGEWLGAPGKPTVFLYAHHDVQPVNDVARQWQSDPWTLTRARRPALRPRRRRRQGRHHRPARGHRRLPQDAREAAGQRQDARRGRGRGRLRQPARLLQGAQETHPVRRDRRLRHREHRDRPAEHHLFAARHRGGAWSRCRAPRCRSTAAWPAACWPTRPWP